MTMLFLGLDVLSSAICVQTGSSPVEPKEIESMLTFGLLLNEEFFLGRFDSCQSIRSQSTTCDEKSLKIEEKIW